MICLSYDTDHMSAPGMVQFLREFAPPGCGTFYLWQPFGDIDWKGHEIAPHPYLQRTDNLENEIRDFSRSVGLYDDKPIATGMRIHSCVYAHTVGVAAKALGFTYVSMASHPPEAGLHPYRHPWGVWEMPIYYMDNMDFCTPVNWPDIGHQVFSRDVITRAISEPGLFVFDFHPLHIALNTTSYAGYQLVKGQVFNGTGTPYDHALPGYGVRSFYLDLLEAMDKAGIKSVGIADALARYQAQGAASLTAEARRS